jgi:CHAT domain-containing protein
VPVPRALLRKTIQAWRKALTDPQTAPPEALRKQLYAWLLQPVQGLSEAKRVLALPTDALWYLPLDSLESVGEREWCQLTPPDLAMLELAPARTPCQPLVLGPSADADLPGASEEARELARMLPQCRLLEGKGATRAALRQLSPTASILHFCTHGLVESGDLNDSFLKLGDGPLTLQDVYGLRLPKGALVVLSACSTGLGEQTPGRAVTSLASAFRAAGASSVVSTLWPVEDQPTRKLMLAFYGGLEHGLGRAAALEQAKLQLSRQPGYAHPFYWAGFTLSGDPR